MPRDLSAISSDEALEARQRALEIEEQKKLSQKERIRQKKKRIPKNAPASLKERMVAPFFLFLTLLVSWLVLLLSSR